MPDRPFYFLGLCPVVFCYTVKKRAVDTMTALNISQAAKRVGVSRQTFYRHIEKKGISTGKDAEGNPVVDVSELLRVYGPGMAAGHRGDDKRDAPPRQRGTDNPDKGLERLVATLQDQLERAQEREGRLLAQVERLSLLIPPPRAEPVPVEQPAAWPSWFKRLFGG